MGESIPIRDCRTITVSLDETDSCDVDPPLEEGGPQKYKSEGSKVVTVTTLAFSPGTTEGQNEKSVVSMSAAMSTYDSRFDSMVFAHGESGVVGGVFNYTNVIIGSGIVGMPFALYNCGLWLGIILLVMTGCFTALASHWIIKTGLKRHHNNYEDLVRDVIGPLGGYLHCAYTFVFAYTGCMAYLLIGGESLRDVALSFGATGIFADRRFYTIVGGLFICLPLSCLRDMHLLRPVSLISITSEAITVLVIVAHSAAYSLKDTNSVVPFRDDKAARLGYFVGPNVFQGLSVFLFTFIGQHASFEVYRSLKKPTFSRWKKIANSAVSVAWVLSTTFVITTYLNLGDSIEGNIMSTFDESDTPLNVCKFLLGTAMFLTFPMDLFVSRQVTNQGIFVDGLEQSEYMPPWRFYSITVFLVLVLLVLVFFISDLTSVIGLGGSVGGSFVGYTMPASMFLKAFQPEIKRAFKESTLKGLSWTVLPVACFLFGLMALVAGTYATLKTIV